MGSNWLTTATRVSQMAVDTTACHSDEPVETCIFITDAQNLRLTYSDASTLSRVIY